MTNPINNPATNASEVTAPEAAPPNTATPKLYALSHLLPAWRADAEAAHDARVNGTPRGPLSGLSTLDRELGGAMQPGVHVVHGQPGTGKTAFALQIAASCQCPALYVTCEMSPLELLRRLTARVTDTYLGRLKSGELTPESSLALAQRAIYAAPQLSLIDATQAYASPQYLHGCAQIARREGRHLLIVVDSVHSWAEGAVDGATEYDALNAGLAALRSLSHRLECPILAIAERNRESMSSGGLSAGAGSRKIEYGAETVIGLHREADAREDGHGEVEIKAKFAKNRNGAAGKTVALRFNGALQRFQET